MGRGICQGLGCRAAFAAALLVFAAACQPEEPPACPIGQVQDTDTSECVPEHCGADAWGLLERTGETIHVAPWGDDDWDGSAEWPYRTIQQGADEADGGLVAVAAGTYVENLELDGDHDGVEIAGRCLELTAIDGSGEEAPGVRVSNGVVGIRGLTVTGGWRGIDIGRQFNSAKLVGLNLLLEGNHDLGLYATDAGTDVDLRDVTVRDTQPLPDGTFGWGIDVEVGASLVARGLLLEGNSDVGLIARDGGTAVDLEDTTVRDTQPRIDGTSGRGVVVQDDASLIARGLVLEGNHGLGLLVASAGTSVVLDDTTVRDTQPRIDGTGGRGIAVQDGASLVARGVLLEGNHEFGLFAIHAGTSVDLQNATIRGVQQLSDGTSGGGICVQDGASLVARSLLLEENHLLGLLVTDTGTSVNLEDTTVRDTQPLPDGTHGRGISVQGGAILVARVLLLEGNHELGLFAGDAGTTVDLEDARIFGTGTPVNVAGGFGIVVQQGASLTALNLQVEDNEGPGLYLVSNGSLEALGVTLQRNAFAAAVVLDGRLVLSGGTVSGSTFHPSEAGGVGVFTHDRSGPPDIEVDNVSFTDLAGPALYLRGPGRCVMRGCDVQDTGTWPWLPGGVFAVEGVQPWHEVGDSGYFTGLLLEGNTFSGLNSDAILLDSSSVTLDLHPETGAPNTFGSLDGEPLVRQRCDGVETPEILDSSIPDPTCEPVPRGLGPLLEYRLWLAEVEPLE